MEELVEKGIAENITTVTLLLGGSAYLLPMVQQIEIECAYMTSKGEAIGGPYGTTFRPSFYTITVSGYEPFNTDFPIINKLYQSISNVSEAVSPELKLPSTFEIKIDGKSLFDPYYVMPYGMKLDLTTKEKSRFYTLSFIGQKVLNGFLRRNELIGMTEFPIISHMSIPMRSGRWII